MKEPAVNIVLEKAVRALRSLPWCLCAAALLTSPCSAEPAEGDASTDPAVWLEHATTEARTITGRGAELTAALRDKGRLLAQAAGLAAAAGDTQRAERWFTLAELCERALTHRKANGPVTAALVASLAQAGRSDEASKRIDTLADDADRIAARAALAQALAQHTPDDARATALRAQAQPTDAAAWSAAFVAAGDLEGLAALVTAADLQDNQQADLLANLGQAQAKAGDLAQAQHHLDHALALRRSPPAPTLAQAKALAAMGQIDEAAAAIGRLPQPAEQIRGLSHLADARAAAGDAPGALKDLQTAAEWVRRFPDAPGLPDAAGTLAQIAAHHGHGPEIGAWIQNLTTPRLRASAALGLAQGLSTPRQHTPTPPALAALAATPDSNTTPDTTQDPAPDSAQDQGSEPSSGANTTVAESPVHASAPDPAAKLTDTPSPVADADVAIPASGPSGEDADTAAASAQLNQSARRAIDQAMATLPGAPINSSLSADPAPSQAEPRLHAPRDITQAIENPAPSLAQVPKAVDKPTATEARDVIEQAAATETPAPIEQFVNGESPNAIEQLTAAVAPDAIEHPATIAAPEIPVMAVPNLRRLANPDDPQFNVPCPAVYDAQFTTTRGSFTLRIHRSWAPLASDRFYQLSRAGFYNNNRFYRVVPGFVAQWGIHGFPNIATAWRTATLPDEPARERNRRGTVSFAASAVPNTRTTQVFVNLSDNSYLDDLGFAPFGEVVQGMDVVEQLFSGYGETPSQQQRRIQLDGNAFLDKTYPNLDGVVGVEVSGVK